jgi:penicillin amidase
MEQWRWGDIHETVYAHVPFSSIDAIASIFERRIPSGGSTNTIDVADATYKPSEKYEQTFGAGFRQIVQWGRDGQEPAAHWYMNSTGQSGNVFSKHYDDMIKKFRDGEYFEMSGAAETGSNSKNKISAK